MKTILIAIMLLATLQSNGQTGTIKDTRPITQSWLDSAQKAGWRLPSLYIRPNPMIFHNDPIEMSAYLKNDSDTIEIFPGKQIHFIKIGDRVYKIESPRLVEVEKYSPVLLFYNSQGKYVTTDTMTKPDKYYIAEPYRKPTLPIKQP